VTVELHIITHYQNTITSLILRLTSQQFQSYCSWG